MKNISNIPNEIYICVPVWGREFSETFLNYSLKSLLSAKNLPEIAKSTVIKFTIYTDKNSYKIMKKSKYFDLLCQYVEVDIFLIKGFSIIGNYMAMNDCHRHFIAANFDKSLILICPDMIFSDGALGYLYNLHQMEKKTICINTPRLDKSSFLKSYNKKISIGGLKALNNEDLICLSLEHLHPETKYKIMNIENEETTNAGGFYLSDQDGLIGYQFHWYPIIFKTTTSTQLPTITIDYDFLDKNISSTSKIILVKHAIDCCVVDVTDGASANLLRGKRSVEQLVQWATINAKNIHRNMFDELLYFRKNKLSPPEILLEQVKSLQSSIKTGIIKSKEVQKNFNKLTPVQKLIKVFRNNSITGGSKKIMKKIYILVFRSLIIK